MSADVKPIGVFDSGIGGLSVLRHIQQHLPHENLVYFADAGYAPYGEKQQELIIERALLAARFLIRQQCKALVVACNTATAAAIHLLREAHPKLPIIGVEPGLKPATAITKNKTVGVLATENTLNSDKFQQLRDQLTGSTGVRFITQACPGLAEQIENGEIDSIKTAAMLQSYITPLIEQNADTVVLGCTHYPFLQQHIYDTAIRVGAAATIQIIDTGKPVALQLARQLETMQSGANFAQPNNASGSLKAFTTGNPTLLAATFERLLAIRPSVQQVIL